MEGPQWYPFLKSVCRALEELENCNYMSVCGIIQGCPQLMEFVYAKLQSRDNSLSSKQAGTCSMKSKMHILALYHNIVCIPKLFLMKMQCSIFLSTSRKVDPS